MTGLGHNTVDMTNTANSTSTIDTSTTSPGDTSTTANSSDIAGPTGADPDVSFDTRPLFAQALATARAAVGSVSAGQLELSTPCAEFDVRALLGHLTAVVQRVAAVGQGKSAFSVPDTVEGIADDAWLATWDSAIAEQQRVWSDDSVLTTIITLPWASLPGSAILGMYTNEVSVHTWDLAQAVGYQPSWNEGALKLAMQTMFHALPADGRAEEFEAARANMPEEHRDFTPPFAEVVAVSSDAPLIDRLVAWNGRSPVYPAIG